MAVLVRLENNLLNVAREPTPRSCHLGKIHSYILRLLPLFLVAIKGT